MNCNEIRELISCMLDNELSAEDSAIVGEHLVDCPECMRVFEAFHSVSLTMEDLEDVPDGFTEGVMARIAVSAETPTPKKQRGGFLRIAGLVGIAACAAFVMMAGTRFASTHMYVGEGNGDTAEYVHIQHKTPAPIWGRTNYTTTPDVGSAQTTDTMPKDIADALSADPSASPDAELLNPVSVSPEAEPGMTGADASPSPSENPTPIPVITPTPVPPMQLMIPADLLIVDAEADFGLFTDHPAYEIAVTDESGAAVDLKIWSDEERIYCKNEAAQTAWYTVGTPDQLSELLGEPAASPIPATPTPTAVQPTPTDPQPTPDTTPVVTPKTSPMVTPDVTPKTSPTVTPDVTPKTSPMVTPAVTPAVTPIVTPAA